MAYSICTVTGREFISHCREGVCPLGKFPAAPRQWQENIHACARCPKRERSKPDGPRRRRFGPGDLVAVLVKVATAGRVKMCVGCRGRRMKMNRLGWWACLTRPWRVVRLFTAAG